MNDISFEIRSIIFDKFNSDDRFTNDQIYAELKSLGKIEKSLTIDDLEQ